jgi:hypothetical protein
VAILNGQRKISMFFQGVRICDLPDAQMCHPFVFGAFLINSKWISIYHWVKPSLDFAKGG